MVNATTTTKEKVMTDHNIRLTAAELGVLWTQYLNDSLATCVLKYFANICEDKQVLPSIKYALSVAQKNMEIIEDIFKHENHPVPLGFTDEDVNINAPRLFSDTFILTYLRNMSIIVMAGAGVAIGVCARSDVSDFIRQMLDAGAELHDQTRKVALEKGVYIRPPYISNPEKVDFVQRQGFLFDFLGKNTRPLTAIEITHLFLNIQTNAIGKAMMMAFAQVCKAEDVKQYFLEGKGIANKHIKKFSKTLTDEDLPSPMVWDSHVTDSTVALFSDKLMTFHTTLMIATGIGNYGTAAGTCQRMDLSAMYARLAGEIALYAEDGANILITHGWLEEPPQADNRQALIGQPK